MSVQEIIESSQDLPLDRSISSIARALHDERIYIPIAALPSEDRSVQLLTAKDRDGNPWLYIYSDEKELTKVFQGGAKYITFSLDELEQTIKDNQQFRGIYLNSSYPIPAELFGLFFTSH